MLRREREQEQEKKWFPCSADHEQDWQPSYPVDASSAIISDGHTTRKHYYMRISSPTKTPSSEPNARASKKPAVRTRNFLLWSGALLRINDHRLPKRVMWGELENTGKRGLGRKEKIMDGLRGRGSSAIWHHGGGLAHRRT